MKNKLNGELLYCHSFTTVFLLLFYIVKYIEENLNSTLGFDKKLETEETLPLNGSFGVIHSGYFSIKETRTALRVRFSGQLCEGGFL